MSSNVRAIFATSTVVALGLVALILGLSAFQVVEPGTRGVYVLFGSVDPGSLDEGLHWKNPFADIKLINVRQVIYDKETDAASADLQKLRTRIAVNYKPVPDKVDRLYQTIGETNASWENVLLRPAIEEETKAVTAKFTAEGLIKRRDEAKAAISTAITKRLAAEHILVTEVSITDFGFNKAFNDAIEAKQIAEQRAQQEKNELDRIKIQSQQKVVQAENEKLATILSAEAKAEEIRILAEAESNYHRTVGKAATSAGVRLRALEKWDGKMPQLVGDAEAIQMVLGR